MRAWSFFVNMICQNPFQFKKLVGSTKTCIISVPIVNSCYQDHVVDPDSSRFVYHYRAVVFEYFCCMPGNKVTT